MPPGWSNNAGFGTHHAFTDEDPDRLQDMIALNVSALVDLTRAFIEPLTAADNGVLINVASLLGFQPTPYLAVYGATKAFVLSFTESLWEEARGSGLRVLAISPGATETEFYDAAGSQSADYGVKRATPQDVVRIALKTVDRRLRPAVGDHQRPPYRPCQQVPAPPPDRPVHGCHPAPRHEPRLTFPAPPTTTPTPPIEEHFNPTTISSAPPRPISQTANASATSSPSSGLPTCATERRRWPNAAVI